MKTTAAVLRHRGGPLTLEELDIESLGPHEVLVRLVSSGICHTDLGVIAAHQAHDTPIVLGHEGAGIVEAIGAGVTTVAPGAHVVMSYNSCGHCDHCDNALPMHCRQFVELNLTGLRSDGSTNLTADGNPIRGQFFGQSSWAAHAVANENNCVEVDQNLPLELLGPLGCGVQTGAGAVLNTLQPAPGSSIVIFGVGSVGLSALLGAVVAECRTIIAVDLQDSRLQQAVKLGATHTINSATEDVVQRVREITGGFGAQFSVDCIALPTTVRGALECLQSPGVCATVGFQGLPNDITIDQGHLLFGRTLIGVVEGDAIPTQFVPRLIELYQSGRFPFDEFIESFPFERINDALDAVHRGEVTKAVLTFGGDSVG
jgi:aryl-alcohol dehydrogenase